jgi:3'(2'), 5'-bisphosphate nucleotidase
VAGSDDGAACEIAEAAGALLLGIRGQLADGVDPKNVRDEGDRQSHELIVSLLQRDFPGDAILSEEAPDDLKRLECARVWIVDPLDGTREFGEQGRDDWAVHVALLEDGVLTAGAVALPARSITYTTRPAPIVPAGSGRAPRLAVSRTRPAAEAELLAEHLGGELVPMGSAGVKAMAVVTGEVDIYVHSGGQYAWDSAAPVAVAAAAGLHTSRIDGSPLEYDQATTWLPDLLICRPEYRDAALAELARFRTVEPA